MWEDREIKGMIGFRIIMFYNARMHSSERTCLPTTPASAAPATRPPQ
jgi:hypothetical protein